jgi:hypothetical protein
LSTNSFEDTITQKTLQALGPEAKIDVVRGLVKRTVREHPDGVPASTVAEGLGLAQATAKKHLDYLVATREIYSKNYSARNRVYFPNERLSHPHLQSQIELENQIFRISLIENQRGEFVYMQEIQDTPSSGMKVIGGIIIRKQNLDKVIDAIYDVLAKEEREKSA